MTTMNSHRPRLVLTIAIASPVLGMRTTPVPVPTAKVPMVSDCPPQLQRDAAGTVVMAGAYAHGAVPRRSRHRAHRNHLLRSPARGGKRHDDPNGYPHGR